jgi:hypothetical protein
MVDEQRRNLLIGLISGLAGLATGGILGASGAGRFVENRRVNDLISDIKVQTELCKEFSPEEKGDKNPYKAELRRQYDRLNTLMYKHDGRFDITISSDVAATARKQVVESYGVLYPKPKKSFF